MLGKIRQEIECAKKELEYLILKYGTMNKKVLKQSKKLDNLIVDFYNAQEKLYEEKRNDMKIGGKAYYKKT